MVCMRNMAFLRRATQRTFVLLLVFKHALESRDNQKQQGITELVFLEYKSL